MNPRPKKLQLLRWLPTRWLLTRGRHDRHVVHLSFDDGPHPEVTPRLLDLLGEHGAKADFFLVGQQAEGQSKLVERIVREGHRLGNHSWSHPRFETLDLRAQNAEIDRAEALLSSFDGRADHDFRPPRGVLTPALLVDCARRRRRLVFWSYDTLDYCHPPLAELVVSAQRHTISNGDILLLHDDNPLSIDFLRQMLPVWSSSGFAFEPIPEAI